MNIDNLLVESEEVNSGKKVVGFVCCCKDCTTKPYGEELKLDRHKISRIIKGELRKDYYPYRFEIKTVKS